MAKAKKVVVLGLDSATPQLVFDRFRGELEHLTELCRQGVWGELTSVIPAITVPAWACSMTSRDPGQLGIYGFRNRTGYSYDRLGIASSASVKEEAAWDIVSGAGKSVILLAVPPSYPPRPVNGCVVGCFLTPSTKSEYTYPSSLRGEIESVVGDYKIDIEEFRTEDKARLVREAHEMTKQHFALFRHLLRTHPWDFAMMVEIGVDRIHHAFWQHFDETHHRYEPGNPYRDVILDYYRLVDREVGLTLSELDDETAVVVYSDHGARKMVGGVCINEWLIREGYLTLRSKPASPTRLSMEEVDWGRTKAWGEGGYYGRVFLNVQGREPQGTVPREGYEAFRDELAARIRAIPDHEGRDMGTKVYKPEEVYRECRNVPPDLLVYFGDLDWRSAGLVGTGSVHTFENDTGPDDANHSQQGIFIMRVPGLQGGRELRGLQLVDCGPTVLDLLGLPAPAEMVGRVIR